MSRIDMLNERKGKLLTEIYLMEGSELDKQWKDNFGRDFMKFFETLVLYFMDKSENFFASVIIQMERAINFKISNGLSVVLNGDSFKLYINPGILIKCSIKEMEALIKHEVYHLISNHHFRAAALRGKYSQLAINLAMDIVVNQYIINLPYWSETIESVNLSYNLKLSEEGTLEQYAFEIQKKLDKMEKKKPEKKSPQQGDILMEPDISKDHQLWNSDLKNIDKNLAEQAIRKIIDNTVKAKAPKSIQQIIDVFYGTREVNWAQYLKRMIGLVKYGNKKTSTRKNRRQPNRLDLRGELAYHTVNIAVAIDVSGSVSDEEIEKIMAEIFSLVNEQRDKIIIMECDNEVRKVYSVNNTRQLRKKVDTKGGTKFSPVFQFLNENGMENYLLVYFTDGLGEVELSVEVRNKAILWVLTGENNKLSLDNPPGMVLKLKKVNSKEKISIHEYIKTEMGDMKSEWAK